MKWLLIMATASITTHFQYCDAIQISCRYATVDYPNFGHIYECDATVSLDAQSLNRVTAVSGTHNSGKGNADVQGLRFESQKLVEFFLMNIQKYFPNLKLLYFLSTSISHISNAHLLPLTNLEYLALDNNKITSLDSNLFSGFESMKLISFNKNNIKHVGLDFILPNQNALIDFSDNSCVNMKAESPAQISLLRQNLLANCPPAGLATINGQIQSLVNRMNNIDQTHFEMNNEVNSIKTELGEVQQSNSLLIIQMSNLQQSNLQLTHQMTSLQQSNTQLSNDVTDLQQGNLQLISQVTSLQQSTSQLSNDVTDLQEINSQLTNEVTELNDEVATLQQSNLELINKNSQLETRIGFLNTRTGYLEVRVAVLERIIEGKLGFKIENAISKNEN